MGITSPQDLPSLAAREEAIHLAMIRAGRAAARATPVVSSRDPASYAAAARVLPAVLDAQPAGFFLPGQPTEHEGADCD